MLLLIQYTLIFASVLLLVALGGCISEHSGVINLGLEGIMVVGALGGALVMRSLNTSSAVVMVLGAMLAALLSGIIILLLTGGTGAFWNGQPLDFSELWNAISNYPNSGKVILLIAEFLALAVLSFLKSVLAVYAAITIGHLVRNHVVLASIGAYIGLMIFESSVGNIFISLGLTTGENTDLNTLFSSNFAATQMLVGVSFLISVALIAIYFFICKYIMENKLNLA